MEYETILTCLGIKPMSMIDNLILTKKKNKNYILKLINKFNLIRIDKNNNGRMPMTILINKKSLNDIFLKHKDKFPNQKTLEELIHTIENNPDDLSFGILLGYPEKTVQIFESGQKNDRVILTSHHLKNTCFVSFRGQEEDDKKLIDIWDKAFEEFKLNHPA